MDQRCLHELFEAQAARTPEATAVVCEGQRLSYGELNARANRLAHRLQQLGIGPEQRVGILLEHSPETMVAVLGILKAGVEHTSDSIRSGLSSVSLSHLADAEPALLLTAFETGLCGTTGAVSLPGAVFGRRGSWACRVAGDESYESCNTGRLSLSHLHIGFDRATQGRNG